jgi:hypothetical protein
VVAFERARDEDPWMKRRILAAFLWFYAWWYAGAITADVLGVSPALGPIVGAAAAALFLANPLRIVWYGQGRSGIQQVR